MNRLPIEAVLKFFKKAVVLARGFFIEDNNFEKWKFDENLNGYFQFTWNAKAMP